MDRELSADWQNEALCNLLLKVKLRLTAQRRMDNIYFADKEQCFSSISDHTVTYWLFCKHRSTWKRKSWLVCICYSSILNQDLRVWWHLALTLCLFRLRAGFDFFFFFTTVRRVHRDYWKLVGLFHVLVSVCCNFILWGFIVLCKEIQTLLTFIPIVRPQPSNSVHGLMPPPKISAVSQGPNPASAVGNVSLTGQTDVISSIKVMYSFCRSTKKSSVWIKSQHQHKAEVDHVCSCHMI